MINRVRFGALLTILVGVMWAAVGLFDSLRQVGLGLVVASVGVIVYGAADYVAGRRDELLLGRESVWMRREL